MPVKLYTYGYLGGDVDRLRSVLADPSAMLLDIRYAPASRLPGFSKAALDRAFGAQYRHLKALGNVNYRAGPTIEFRDEAAGVQFVAEMLREGRPIVLMCACRIFEECHRKLAAERVAARVAGVEIVELSAPAVVE